MGGAIVTPSNINIFKKCNSCNWLHVKVQLVTHAQKCFFTCFGCITQYGLKTL